VNNLDEAIKLCETQVAVEDELVRSAAKTQLVTGGKMGNNIQATPEKEHKNKNVKKRQVGVLEPEPPPIVRHILWILLNWKKHWKILILAGLILLISSGVFVWLKVYPFRK
jgi:hypothetical protein